MSARILLVEDNDELAAGIRHNLEIEGYEVAWAGDGPRALELIRAEAPDLIILDLMLPGMDGFQVLRRLRSEGRRFPCPHSERPHRRVGQGSAGFRMDADQYLTKPFGLMEFLERVRALLRKSRRGEDTAQGVHTFGDVRVDIGARTVTRGGEAISVTPKAFDLLIALISNPGRVLSRPALLKVVWGHRAAIVTRTVDSHISELGRSWNATPRGRKHIHTVWKAGYRLRTVGVNP